MVIKKYAMCKSLLFWPISKAPVWIWFVLWQKCNFVEQINVRCFNLKPVFYFFLFLICKFLNLNAGLWDRWEIWFVFIWPTRSSWRIVPHRRLYFSLNLLHTANRFPLGWNEALFSVILVCFFNSCYRSLMLDVLVTFILLPVYDTWVTNEKNI